MKNVMGVIYTGEKDSHLRELTISRAIAAMPVAGRYRVIDFIMSNLVSSGVRNVGVIMQKNYHSLMDHLGSGKEWDLHGKNDGLFILPPYLTNENVGLYLGVLDALRSNMSYLKRSKQEYIIFSNSLMVFSTRFDAMLDFHIKSGADITILYSPDPSLQRREYGTYMKLGDGGVVTDVEIDPTTPSYPNTSMEVYLMRRELLIDMVIDGVAHGYHDLTRDVLQKLVRESGKRILGFPFNDIAFRIDSVQAYFDCNLAMLDPKVRHSIFRDDQPVLTKVRDELPARYGDEARLTDALVANGCVIDGTVESSVLFRGVTVARGAYVRNSVVMQDSQIEQGAHLENCILDKQAVIKPGVRLIGPSIYPIVIRKNTTI